MASLPGWSVTAVRQASHGRDLQGVDLDAIRDDRICARKLLWLRYPDMTHVSVGRHRRFRVSPDIPCWRRRAVAAMAHTNNLETLIKAVMRCKGSAGDRPVSCEFATPTGRPGSYFPVRLTSR